MGHDKSEHINSENSRETLRSLGRRWAKISKFLGDLPSEQIFYRNIPLGAPGNSHDKTKESNGKNDFTKPVK